jgi:hypothetical protein
VVTSTASSRKNASRDRLTLLQLADGRRLGSIGFELGHAQPAAICRDLHDRRLAASRHVDVHAIVADVLGQAAVLAAGRRCRHVFAL